MSLIEAKSLSWRPPGASSTLAILVVSCRHGYVLDSCTNTSDIQPSRLEQGRHNQRIRSGCEIRADVLLLEVKQVLKEPSKAMHCIIVELSSFVSL